MKFWAEKGIDGFRLDAFQFAAKDTSYPPFPDGYEKDFMKYYAMQGDLHGYLKEMNEKVFSKYKVLSVAEGAGNSFEDAHHLVDADRKELNMAYAFEGVDIAKPEGYSLLVFKEVFSRWDSAFANKGWLSIFLSNHDQARMVSRFGNDDPAYRSASASMLNTFIMTMRGTPYIYNGDELGMTNAGFKDITEFRDVQTLNEYKRLQVNNGDLSAYLKKIQASSRDNGRTPFQWDNSKNAGFTTGLPWIKVNANHTEINVAQQEKDPGSCLNYFKKLVQLRKDHIASLVYGKYTLLDKNNPNVYAYTRESDGEKLLIVLNFSKETTEVSLGLNMQKTELLLSNLSTNPVTKSGTISLAPYQAVIYKM
jgi:oligo-1,6-glucosidase